MTKRSLDDFINASTGLFKDNTSGDISEGDLRDFTETAFGGLYLNASSADADVTGVVGTMHAIDISGYTAGHTFSLPSTAAVGDRVGVMITTGDDAFELAIRTTAASNDTINGVDHDSSDFTKLFITGEVMVFRCVVADTAWIVEHDGRIPCVCNLSRNAAQSISNGSTVQIQLDTSNFDNGSLGDVSTNYRITLRRAGTYQLSAAVGIGNIDSGDTVVCYLYKNGSKLSTNTNDSTRLNANILTNVSFIDEASDADYYDLRVLHTEGASQNTLTDVDLRPFVGAIEVI